MLWLLGAFASSTGLLEYNRDNFMFDSELKLKRVFQGQAMRIAQSELYREDIRDLVNLTVSKMDNYLIINTLQLGMCVILLTEGRPGKRRTEQSPPWLHWLYAITTCGALLYFLLSVWLAMHASIAAHSFGVRLLTQFVRLPVPNKEQIDSARNMATDFEGMGMSDLLRIPAVRQQLRRLNEAMDDSGSPDDDPTSDSGSGCGGDSSEAIGVPNDHSASAPAVLPSHLKLFRKLQTNWQAYDAYARVCMTMGTNQLLQAVCYFCLGILIAENNSPAPAFACVIILCCAAWLIIRLDLYIPHCRLVFAAGMIFCAPLLTLTAVTLIDTDLPKQARQVGELLIPLAYSVHLGWLVFMLVTSRANHYGPVALPANYRTVLYLDVFGWFQPSKSPQLNRRSISGAGNTDQTPTSAEEHQPAANVESPSMPSAESHSPVAQQSASTLRTSLCQRCLQLKVEIETELRAWGNHRVLCFFDSQDVILEEVEDMRFLWDQTVRDLDIAMSDAASEAHEATVGWQNLWLRLEWDPSGSPVEFFYKVETAESKWTQPQDSGDHISDIRSLGQRLDMFAHNVQALADSRGDSSSPAAGESRERASSTEMLSSALSGAQGIAQSLPQQTSDEGVNARDEASIHSAPRYRMAEAPFFPHQRSNAELRSRRPPGQIPWNTFLQGSLLLIAVWSIGTLWTVVSVIFQSEIILVPSETPAFVRIVDGPWPSAYYKPVGMACSPALGELALIVGKFSVHIIGLDGEREHHMAPALTECLAASPDFHAAGISDVSLNCSAANSPSPTCAAWLLSSSGKRALKCDFVMSNDAYAGAGDMQIAGWKEFDLHGGPWRSIAFSRGGQLISMEKGRLVQMRMGLNNRSEFLPHRQLPHVMPHDTFQFHVLPSSKTIALGPHGHLSAWDSAGERIAVWHKGLHSWMGTCASARSVFALSSHFGSVKLWEMHLPGVVGRVP